jgi:hypothetical protein
MGPGTGEAPTTSLTVSDPELEPLAL